MITLINDLTIEVNIHAADPINTLYVIFLSMYRMDQYSLLKRLNIRSRKRIYDSFRYNSKLSDITRIASMNIILKQVSLNRVLEEYLRSYSLSALSFKIPPEDSLSINIKKPPLINDGSQSLDTDELENI